MDAEGLEAGKHVLSEKPIALAAEEVDGADRARDRSGNLAAEAFMVTHHPQWLRTRELVAGRRHRPAGPVQGAFSFFQHDPVNIRNDASRGGGALRDIGVYPTVTTRFVTGAEPVAVTHAEIDWDLGVDATVRAMAAFPDFHLESTSRCGWRPGSSMMFHGDGGLSTVHAPFNAYAYADQEIEIRDASGRVHDRALRGAEQYRAQANAFNASVLDGVPYGCTLEFSRGNQRIIDMIYAAAGPRPA